MQASNKSHSFTFPQQARLKTANDFSKVFQQASGKGFSYGSPYFTILAIKREDGNKPYSPLAAQVSTLNTSLNNNYNRDCLNSSSKNSSNISYNDSRVNSTSSLNSQENFDSTKISEPFEDYKSLENLEKVVFEKLDQDKKAQGARLGLVMQKKNFKKAVTRNRLKRLFREYFRQHRQHLANADIVILGKRSLQNEDNFPLAISALEQAFAKMTSYLNKKR